MRLKLDLGDFLQDERRLSLLCVKTGECLTVGDVVIKICQVFNVGPTEAGDKSYADVALFDDGFFIHPSQCSSVLEGGGVLKLQWLHSQEAVKKKKKKKNSNDDIEFIEFKRNDIKKENDPELESVKTKGKSQVQEAESSQVGDTDLESSRKKRKKKSRNSESECSTKYKIPLEVTEKEEKEQLVSISECSMRFKKKRKMTNKEIEDVNEDVKEWVKTKKRIKDIPQGLDEKETATVVKNNDSSSDEITIVESSKSKKSRLKREVDTQIVKRSKNKIPDIVVADSTKSDNVNLKDLDAGKQKEKPFRDQKLIDTNKTLKEVCTEDAKKDDLDLKKTGKEQKTDNSDKTDSDDNQIELDANISENGERKRRRRRKRKKKTLGNCLEKSELFAPYPDTSVKCLLPNNQRSSNYTIKANETHLYNFNYSKPRNKKPMAKGVIPQNKHVIFDNSETEVENSTQKLNSINDNVINNSLNTTLWDISDINVVNNSYYDRSGPSVSTPIISTPDIKVEENSCNEISSTSMQKFILPNTIEKLNSHEENKQIFGNLLTMSKSEEPLICTYAGRKEKEKPNYFTNTVTSATLQHQRRSPPKGAPTQLPQNDDAANIFHNLLATQNFSQAFICPRTPSVSKLIVNNTTIQPVISSTGIGNSTENVIKEEPKLINSLSNDDKSFLKSDIEAADLENDDVTIKEEPENEIDDMIKFTKMTVEANLYEAKAAMNRRKRARPKAVSSIGSLLNRIRSGGLNAKEESENDIEVPIVDIKEEKTSTIDPNELEIREFKNDSNLQPENKNMKTGELDNSRSFDKDVGLIPENIPENIMQEEDNVQENCNIKTVKTNQNHNPEMNKGPELIQREEINDVEADFEVKEIKDTDCMIVNTQQDQVASGSPSRKDHLVSGGPHGSKIRQSPRVSRNPIKTVITVRDEENAVITVKDEDNASTSLIKGKKSYKELGEAFFDQFPVMKGLPKVKEFVAVKLLSLDENCIPVYSNYQQAQILKVQGTSITLRYIDKLEKLPSKDGQAQVVDLTLEGDSNTENIDWRDVYEPRLIYP